jgi:hypothetical protein
MFVCLTVGLMCIISFNTEFSITPRVSRQKQLQKSLILGARTRPTAVYFEF